MLNSDGFYFDVFFMRWFFLPMNFSHLIKAKLCAEVIVALLSIKRYFSRVWGVSVWYSQRKL